MVTIIDNFVDESYVEKILQMVSNQKYLKNSKTTGIIEYDIYNRCYIDERIIDNGQEYCVLAKNNTIEKEIEIVNYLTNQAKNQFPEISKVQRTKINKLSKLENPPEVYFNIPHSDFSDIKEISVNHYSMIYYCNDSDGYTYLFNEFYNPFHVPERLTIHKKVTPKKGRALIFESCRWHASSNPSKNDERIIINFVFNLNHD